MELLKTVRRKTFWSEAVYYAFNIGLAVVLFVMAQTIQTPYPALVLVLLSKWRMMAVRPRFWWANIQANFVDIIVGVSVVGLLHLPGMDLIARAIIASLYALWLVVIKPMGRRWQVAMQAMIAIILGVTTLMAVSYDWPVLIVVVFMFAIGYTSARHYLHSFDDEDQIVLLGAIWGILFAELGWLAYYWNFSYVGVPQVTIILVLLSFVAGRAYQSKHKHGEILLSDILPQLVLATVLILVMLLFFNSAVRNAIA